MSTLLFLGNQACRSAEQQLKQSIQRWMVDWCLFRVEPKVKVTVCSVEDISKVKQKFSVVGNKSQYFAIESDELSWRKILFSDIKLLEQSSQPLHSLYEKARKDFLTTLLKIQSFQPTDKLDVPMYIKSYIRVQVDLAAGGQLVLYTSHAMWREHYKKSGYKLRETNLKRDALIGGNTTTVNVILELEDQPVIDFVNLSKGQIVPLHKAVENKFALTVNEKKVAVVGIGKAADKKAFVILKSES